MIFNCFGKIRIISSHQKIKRALEYENAQYAYIKSLIDWHNWVYEHGNKKLAEEIVDRIIHDSQQGLTEIRRILETGRWPQKWLIETNAKYMINEARRIRSFFEK